MDEDRGRRAVDKLIYTALLGLIGSLIILAVTASYGLMSEMSSAKKELEYTMEIAKENKSEIDQLKTVYVTLGRMELTLKSIRHAQETDSVVSRKNREWQLEYQHIVKDADEYIKEQRRGK